MDVNTFGEGLFYTIYHYNEIKIQEFLSMILKIVFVKVLVNIRRAFMVESRKKIIFIFEVKV